MTRPKAASLSGARSFVPDPQQMALMPGVSGNEINGLGEKNRRRPTPIYWHDPDRLVFGEVQKWFYKKNNHKAYDKARAERAKIMAQPLSPIAKSRAERSPQEWSEEIKRVGLASQADLVGITRLRSEWLFEGYEEPYEWIIMIAVAMDYEKMSTAPDVTAGVEVVEQYGRGNVAARGIANWIREQGWDAKPHGGPMAGSLLLIPPAIACGFGELGKHGSIINRRYGACFRLACVLTDVPLVEDEPDEFGADDFCLNCQVCRQACPPQAIFDTKQVVRGDTKWYVDFDKCLPFFNETGGCAICVAVCPWSRPGIADTLVMKMARRRRKNEAERCASRAQKP